MEDGIYMTNLLCTGSKVFLETKVANSRRKQVRKDGVLGRPLAEEFVAGPFLAPVRNGFGGEAVEVNLVRTLPYLGLGTSSLLSGSPFLTDGGPVGSRVCVLYPRKE